MNNGKGLHTMTKHSRMPRDAVLAAFLLSAVHRFKKVGDVNFFRIYPHQLCNILCELVLFVFYMCKQRIFLATLTILVMLCL